MRAARADLAVRVDRWDTPMPLAAADAVLKDPLSGPGLVEKGSKRLREARGLADLLELAAVAQGGCPSGPAAPLAPLEDALLHAAEEIGQAAAVLGEEERALALEAGRLADAEQAPSGREEAAVAAAAKVPTCRFLRAARNAAQAVEKALPGLKALPPGTPAIEVTDQRGLSLLVSFGGRRGYDAAAAAAGPGELKVVIDLSDDVLIEASTSATQGPASGVLGVGLLYLANPLGTKTLRGGDVSFGAGLLGVGGLYLAGPATIESGSFGQGAAAYGAGVLWSSGAGASFTHSVAGQGYATTRGAGLFAHRGENAVFACGLTRPDAREELGTFGLCQGAGVGPRGFAGGGLGALSVDGDAAVLRSGYMSQGMGYWRAAGMLALRGDGLDVRGRRYVQGAGVHTGVGAVRYEGSSSTFRVWGVGPGFGWDYGVGLFHGAGNANRLASEWAAARGDINAVGLTRLTGKGWRLALPDAGSGAMRRNAPSWGLVAAEDAAVLPSPPDPWGDAPGAVEDAGLSAPAADWPRPEREAALRRDRERVARLLAEADAASPDAQALKLLDAAGAGGLDAAGPREAAGRLIALGPGAARVLLSRLTPERFDDSLWVRLALSAWGHAAADAVLMAREDARPQVRAWRAGALSVTTLRAARMLETSLNDPDWRSRRAGALALGALLSRETGEEPGRLRVLAEAEAVARGRRSSAPLENIGARRLSELLGALALDAYADPADVMAVYAAAPDPYGRFGSDSPPVKAFLAVLEARPAYADALRAELDTASAAAPRVRLALHALLKDKEPEVVHAALTALAQFGEASDAPRVAAFLRDGRALLREAAAAGLGRMGAAARDAIAAALSARTSRERSLAALAAGQSSDPETLALLERAFADRDPGVRATALRALNAVQAPLRSRRAAFKPALRGLAVGDPDPAVRALAARALRSI